MGSQESSKQEDEDCGNTENRPRLHIVKSPKTYPYERGIPVDLELLAEGQHIVETAYGDTDSMGGETASPLPSKDYLRALGQLHVKAAYGDLKQMGGE